MAIGLTAAASSAADAPAPQPTMAGAAVRFMALRDRDGTEYALQAPSDYAWLRVFGTKGHPVTTTSSLTCPVRRSATGTTYRYACSLIVADYAPGKYNVAPPRIMRHADAEAALTLDLEHSMMKIGVKRATVYFATTTPARTAVEPARSMELAQIPL